VSEERLPARAAIAVGEAWLQVLAERHKSVRWTLVEPDCRPSKTLVSEEMEADGHARSD
jgi:hypothetical protein